MKDHRSRRVVRAIVAATVSVVIALAGCRDQPPQDTAVARIENRVLTMQEIRAQFDTARPPSDAQIQQYLRTWIADELLYNEAIRRGLHQSPELLRRTEEMRRQLIIQALLDAEIYGVLSAAIERADVVRYYEEHRSEFTLSQTMVLVSSALFRDRDRATSFRNLVLRGETWNDALQAPGVLPYVVRTRDSIYAVESQLWPRELWRVATTIRPGSPSFPIGTSEGYHVVYVWETFLPGTPADLPSVEGEIRNRLIVERRQRAYRSLVENLRARFPVETYLSPSFGDTTSPSVDQIP